MFFLLYNLLFFAKQINSDKLEGVIRDPLQQEDVVGRALRGSVCSLPIAMDPREEISFIFNVQNLKRK